MFIIVTLSTYSLKNDPYENLQLIRASPISLNGYRTMADKGVEG